MSVLGLFWCLFVGPGDYMDKMVEVRRHLHKYPELSNREVQTQAYLRDQLQKAGFQQITSLAKTGLKVVYDTGRPGKVMAFRADIDALPVQEPEGLAFASSNKGVMHACGHDMHTAIVFGTALAIKNNPSLSGTFVFLFQPAEEGPPPGEEGGASLMIAEGVLENPKPDVIFGLHCMGNLPLGQLGYRVGGIMARADRFFLTVKGVQAHGSMPERGIDPIFVASEIVTGVQSIVSRRIDPRDPVVVSFGEFNSGQRFNIIPEEARLSGTIRALRVETGDRIPELLDQIIGGITQAHGATYTFENETMCPSLQNDEAWTNKSVGVLKSAGFRVVQVEPILAAEDFAYYAEQVPGVYFFLGVCKDSSCANIHSPDFLPAEEALTTGSEAFYQLAKVLSGPAENP